MPGLGARGGRGGTIQIFYRPRLLKKNKMAKTREGQFEVIDSFAIRRRNEFYLIGQVTEGEMREGWFVGVSLNSSLSLTLRIAAIEEVELSSEKNKYKLLIVQSKEDEIDLLLGLNVGSELLAITIEGKD